MATITKKPKRTQSPKLSNEEIDKLISKGGEVPNAQPTEVTTAVRTKRTPQKKVSVQLRLPQGVIDQIDTILDNRIVTISRHTWFLEAIEAKILSERAEG